MEHFIFKALFLYANFGASSSGSLWRRRQPCIPKLAVGARVCDQVCDPQRPRRIRGCWPWDILEQRMRCGSQSRAPKLTAVGHRQLRDAPYLIQLDVLVLISFTFQTPPPVPATPVGFRLTDNRNPDHSVSKGRLSHRDAGKCRDARRLRELKRRDRTASRWSQPP